MMTRIEYERRLIGSFNFTAQLNSEPIGRWWVAKEKNSGQWYSISLEIPFTIRAAENQLLHLDPYGEIRDYRSYFNSEQEVLETIALWQLRGSQP